MIKNHFKTAWQNLRRNKGYSLINILGLAVGIASTIVIALWIKDEVEHDKFHTNEQQLYQVMANTYWDNVTTFNTVPASLNKALKADIPEIAYVTTFSEETALLTVDDTSFKENGGYATSDILQMFTFPLIKGDVQTALSSPGNIVITEQLATKYFGTTDPIGKIIKINNKDVFQVAGVLNDPPSASSLKFDWLIPFEAYEKDNPWLAKWGVFSMHMYVMLKPNIALEDINSKLKHYLQTKTDENNTSELFLQPFADRYLYSNFKNGKQAGGRIEYVQLFSIVAIFILLIACINFMNLSTARAAERAKEVGVRKVIGAGRKWIIGQFMCEATILTLFAFALALLFAWLSLPYFNQLTLKALRIDFEDMNFSILILLVFIATVVLSGSYPSIYLSSFKPVAVFKTNKTRSSKSALFRKGLVVVQFSLAVILIIGTVIIFKQIQYIKTKNLGIDRENLLVVSAESDIWHLDAFQQELAGLHSVIGSTVSADNPIKVEGSSADLDWRGKSPGQLGKVSVTIVGYDYLETLGITIAAGRDFEKGRPDSSNYIINETAARQMGFDDPIGQEISFWMGTGRIIGMVKDFHLHSLHEPITPLVICLDQRKQTIY